MRLVPVAVAAAVVGLTACSGGRTPQPAGVNPSSIAVEVCSTKAQSQIDEVLQVSGTVSRPSWVNHLYACDYDFHAGVIALSVKELSSQAETDAYFDSIGQVEGTSQRLFGLGQAAYATTNGSVVVRKDWKVLLVDTVGFNSQALAAENLGGTPAELVASVIMGCWAGD